jgi:hypothetical protein
VDPRRRGVVRRGPHDLEDDRALLRAPASHN